METDEDREATIRLHETKDEFDEPRAMNLFETIICIVFFWIGVALSFALLGCSSCKRSNDCEECRAEVVPLAK